MRPSAIENSSETLDLAITLAFLVRELEESATRCSSLQWSISSLLEKVHHPDLAEEIHMLQDIDRLQQTLVDIAAVLRVASDIPERVALSRAAVGTAIRLESVRSRIGISFDSGTPASIADRPDGEASEITWF